MHGCFYKVELHCWTRMKSSLKVADLQNHELKFHVVWGDSKLVLGPSEFYQYRCLCGKAIWTGQIWEAPHLHHSPECLHYPQLISSPHIQSYAHHLSSCTVFSRIVLMRAYHQIPALTDDIQKTAITTPFGLFEFPCMPFGLRNCPNISKFYGRNPTRQGFPLHPSGRHPCL